MVVYTRVLFNSKKPEWSESVVSFSVCILIKAQFQCIKASSKANPVSTRASAISKLQVYRCLLWVETDSIHHLQSNPNNYSQI